MSRRLPIYLLLDVSEDLTGDLAAGLQTTVKGIRDSCLSDSMLFETGYVSLIAYAETAVQTIPLTPLDEIKPVTIKTGKSPDIGQALRFAAECAEREVRPPAPGFRGDFSPFLFVIATGKSSPRIDEGDLVRLRRVEWGGIGVFLPKDPSHAEEWKILTDNVFSDWELAAVVMRGLMLRQWLS